MFLFQIKKKIREWAIEEMMKESGVSLVNKLNISEDIALDSLHGNKAVTDLLRKYAQSAGKEALSRAVMDKQYWFKRGQFFCYNSLLIKAKRANERQAKNRKQDQSDI